MNVVPTLTQIPLSYTEHKLLFSAGMGMVHWQMFDNLAESDQLSSS